MESNQIQKRSNTQIGWTNADGVHSGEGYAQMQAYLNIMIHNSNNPGNIDSKGLDDMDMLILQTMPIYYPLLPLL